MSPYTDKGNVQELGSLYWLVEAGVSLRSPYNSPTSSPLSDLRVNATVPPLGWAFDFDADPYRYWEEPFFTSQNTTRKGGFYMDKDGLHFSFDASSGNASVVISKPKGWMLCDWAYEGPQIVVRQRSGKATPSTCADIWLMPRYKK
ncbi:Hypothetical protein D9617_1g084330 [Elsinoe fawcettii]|nr:Hypothetical protein D9617_1g084330 [Elsinoe fawcettii]